MNKNEQRKAIAEKCGWHNVRKTEILRGQPGIRGLTLVRDLFGVPPNKSQDEIVPDYPNDLNAMHEAEKVLRENQFHFVDYPKNLFKIITGRDWNGDMGYFMFNFTMANAAERAEAFCRTLFPEKFQ